MIKQRHRILAFGISGTLAFVLDATVLWLVLDLLGFYIGRLLSFMLAVTFTWGFNRTLTFRDRGRQPPLRQWCRYVLANSFGGVANYGVYSLLVLSSATVAAYPVLGVAAGSLVGMTINYALSATFVFRQLRHSME